MDTDDFDFVIAGGGLAGGLVALALADRWPAARVALVEGGATLGGNHTWSFHDSDLPEEARGWVMPLVAHRWSGQQVIFPDGARTFEEPYASISSARFDEIGRARLTQAGVEVIHGDAVEELGPHGVRTAGGRRLRAPVVIDARGPAPSAGAARGCGYQKFLGLEVELDADAGPLGERPLLMDATVPQRDGFRFIYVLPFGPRRLLVEDTYYADDPALDRPRLRREIAGYLSARGHAIHRIVREETGVLPLPWTPLGSPPAGSPFSIGYRGGWYHPLTGYSFPIAVRVAMAIAAAPDPAAIQTALATLWREHVRQARFCQLLTRLLFTAMPPAQRWQLLARFYRLPPATIARFYALRMTLADQLRLVIGRPPRALSLRSALFAKEAP